MPQMRYVTWSEFDRAVQLLAERVRAVGATSVTGIPRGGLPLAVAVSHAAGVSFRTTVARDTMVLDDIADTGKTVGALSLYRPELLAVWFLRSTCQVRPWAVVEEREGAWLVFPWESKDKAAADYADFQRRRA